MFRYLVSTVRTKILVLINGYLFVQSLTLQEAKVLTLKVLKQVMEEKLDENNVQLALVTPKQRFSILGKEELREVIDKVESTPAASETPEAGAAGATGTTATSSMAET